MAQTSPAWKRLVEEGWFSSRDEAERWIMSGKVRAGNKPVTTAGQPVHSKDVLHVRGADQPYTSKGGLKLEGALAAFAIPVQGRVCIDAGASTGGFTDCLVKHGASTVYAVDVGYGQLAGSLRANPAVVNLERTNIGDDALLSLSPTPTLGTVDLSYLSLLKAIPQFAAILQGHGDLICLVKPLFEIDDQEARRSGVIAPEAYAPLLHSLCDAIIMKGFPLAGICHSPVTGNTGTHEFFFHLALDAPSSLPQEARDAAIEQAVSAALALPTFHKA